MKIRKLSLKWRVTLMTMGMIAISCILMKTLLCSYGLSMMDELGQYALGFSTECGQAMHDGEAERFRTEFSAELAAIKTSFCHNSWYVVHSVGAVRNNSLFRELALAVPPSGLCRADRRHTHA